MTSARFTLEVGGHFPHKVPRLHLVGLHLRGQSTRARRCGGAPCHAAVAGPTHAHRLLKLRLEDAHRAARQRHPHRRQPGAALCVCDKVWTLAGRLPLRVPLSTYLLTLTHQVQYSLLDLRAEGGMLDLARARGVKIAAYATLAGGWLSDRWLGGASAGAST